MMQRYVLVAYLYNVTAPTIRIAHSGRRTIDRSIETREFRPIDRSYTVEVRIVPLVMLPCYSLCCCDPAPKDPAHYLESYLDLALSCLRPTAEARHG